MRPDDDEEIPGTRVVLVPLRAADADELAGLLDDPAIRGPLGVGDLDGLRRRFARWETRRSPDGRERWLNWVLRRDGRAVGWAQATVRDDRASVAYALLPAERGKGAASDAVRTLTDWLRRTQHVREVTASIAPANAPSVRVARAAGFTPSDRREAGEVVWVANAP